MDALVVQVAREYDAELISFDRKMMKKVWTILKKN
jgi:predicted nucleic acid-binding protein